MAWLEDKKVGDCGEAYVKKLMENRNHKVEDVTDNPTYWKKDIDFIISGKTVEVKTDRVINRTGNIWLEDTIEHLINGCVEWVTDGWWRVTEAEYIFYLDGVSLDLYIYRKEDIEVYIRDNAVSKAIAQDSKQLRIGYCIPAYKIPHQKISAVAA